MSGACLFPSNVCSKIPFQFPSTLCPENIYLESLDLIRENRNFSASESCTQVLKLFTMKLPTSEFCVDNEREKLSYQYKRLQITHFILPTAILIECTQNNAYNHFTHKVEIYQMRVKNKNMSHNKAKHSLEDYCCIG